MANRDPSVFADPDNIVLDRKGNRHFSFGIGVHRCIGSNVARTVFKSMLTAVLDRMPDYRCDPEGAVHYETHRRHPGHAPAAGHLHARPPGSAPASTRLWRSCNASATSRNWPGRSPSAKKPRSSTEPPQRPTSRFPPDLGPLTGAIFQSRPVQRGRALYSGRARVQRWETHR